MRQQKRLSHLIEYLKNYTLYCQCNPPCRRSIASSKMLPHYDGTEIAILTVEGNPQKNQNELEIIFSVFKDKDYEIYKRLLLTD